MTARDLTQDLMRDGTQDLIPSSGLTGMAAVEPSAVMDLWGADTASYSGSGIDWNNLIKSPADGSSQSANDIKFADLATNDPVAFTDGYFTPDGVNDGGVLKAAATDFWNSLHKSIAGNAWWIAWDIDLSALGSNIYLLAQNNASGTQQGLVLRIDTTGGVDGFQANGSGLSNYASASGLVSTGRTRIIMTYDYDTSTIKTSVNGTITDGTWSFGATTADATDKPHFGIFPNLVGDLPNNINVYGIAAGNAFLDDTRLSALNSYMVNR